MCVYAYKSACLIFVKDSTFALPNLIKNYLRCRAKDSTHIYVRETDARDCVLLRIYEESLSSRRPN